MLSEISSRQLAEWMAFSMIEPFGFDADMLAPGIVSAAVFNSRRTKEAQKYFQPKDFMPQMKERTTPSASDFFANLKTMLLLSNKKE